MPELWSNNAASTLGASINNVTTTITVGSGEGAKFPSPSGGDFFYATLQEGATIEIVKCTSRSTDTLTVVRAQQGTSASSFTTAAKVENRLTKSALEFLRDLAVSALQMDGSQIAAKLSISGNVDENQFSVAAFDASQTSPILVINGGSGNILEIYADGTMTFTSTLVTIGSINVYDHMQASLIHQNFYQILGAAALRL